MNSRAALFVLSSQTNTCIPTGSTLLGPYVSIGPRMVIQFGTTDKLVTDGLRPYGFKAKVEFKTGTFFLLLEHSNLLTFYNSRHIFVVSVVHSKLLQTAADRARLTLTTRSLFPLAKQPRSGAYEAISLYRYVGDDCFWWTANLGKIHDLHLSNTFFRTTLILRSKVNTANVMETTVDNGPNSFFGCISCDVLNPDELKNCYQEFI